MAASIGLFDRLGPEGAVWLRLVWAAPILFVAARPWQAWPPHPAVATCVVLGIATAA